MTKPERGRPLNPETHQAILDAVPELLASMRYADLTFDRIAAAAGVGKAAIFRRWKSKAALVTDALRIMFEASNPVLPCSGDPLQDIRILLDHTVHWLTRTPAGAVMRHLISELPHEPQLAKMIADLETARRRLILDVLAPWDEFMNRDILVALLFGPLYFRWLMTGE
ncbi:MAG TPA: TetR-like C-terminal domain-containing protein, partial [Oligoflexus sp.]|uniref:TetR-like C-terminal domain-containing protein n=1 Tax=Oligoflexus sp. TaxID=1971216 RepID=UPI002D7E34C0